MATYLTRMHHISLHVSNVDKINNDFVSKFKFHLIATRLTDRSRQLAFRTGSAVLVVNERRGNRSTASAMDGNPVVVVDTLSQKQNRDQLAGCLYDISPHYPVDTACNVCYEVEDVHGSFDALQRLGCTFLVPPTTVHDQQGQVIYAVLKSIVGNVCHTLIDKTKYKGSFLPGFNLVDKDHSTSGDDCHVTHVDHITLACPIGFSQQVMRWYKQVFGFQRFSVNRNDNVDDGFVIHHNRKGIRLYILEYLKCPETSLAIPCEDKHELDCKFVVAESLPGEALSERNQVDTFLEEHWGAGIQHIALHTSDILSTTQTMMDAGVPILLHPADYYAESEKLQEILDIGYDPQKMCKLGILLDTDTEEELLAGQARKYLLQGFTKPLFEEDTFFLELIERRGVAGLGEGNIKALWDCMQNYMDGANGKDAPKTAP
ncbi:4-hydroxyphenylpyruvate dioxygenase-like protein [Dunckerocampus dactyliophorus]|uniref:4-hydroxyphenylpyruvate dioxygenase-like protein n=1 Tax=Dunckerocampus dactyliophorus TaxID=161453 RepID=UPI0024070376|nr:4-hydroxyphenylpyruvate dioxygenase-like protein [Dunckerocampus dactyliophorus]